MTMYYQIWTDYQDKLKGIPAKRTLYLGQAMRFIREESRKSRTAVAEEAKIGLPLLKAMETKREVHSTWENISNLARALNVPVEKLIQRSREEFPNNFFVQKKSGWNRLEYDGAVITPLTPPSVTRSDFLLLKISLEPQKSISKCIHPEAREIACYVTEGPLKFNYGGKITEVRANQSFFFDGSVSHDFANENQEKTIEFYVAINPLPHKKSSVTKAPCTRKENSLDLAYALEYVRQKASPAPAIPLPWNILSEMTGISVRALMHLKTGQTEIVCWDKLEALANGTGIPLEEIMDVATGKKLGRFELCNSIHRGHLDYDNQFGIKIYSAVRPGTARRQFFVGQVTLSARSSIHSLRRRWKYQTNAMMCAIVHDGRILVEYGERKKETLSSGDSVYLDANLEFVIHNLEHQDSRLYLFTHPPLF